MPARKPKSNIISLISRTPKKPTPRKFVRKAKKVVDSSDSGSERPVSYSKADFDKEVKRQVAELLKKVKETKQKKK